MANAGDITQVRVWILGNPGTDPTDYRVVVQKDTGGGYVNYIIENFTAGINTELLFAYTPATFTVAAADGLRVVIQALSAPTRTPHWSHVFAAVTVKDTVVWTFGAMLPAGNYCLESTK